MNTDNKDELENLKNLMQAQVDIMLKKSDTDDWNEFMKSAKEEKAELYRQASEYQNCEVCGEKFLPKDNETICEDCLIKKKRERFKKRAIATTSFFAIILAVTIIIYLITEII